MQLNLIPCDELFGSLEERLQSYANNGQLDTSAFYPQIRWFISQLGLAVYEQSEAISVLDKNRAELPCDFYMLDSAWLCDQHSTSITDNFQGKYVYYTTTTCETFEQSQNCPPPNALGLSVSCRGDGKLIDKITVTEYVNGVGTSVIYGNPMLLKLNPQKQIGKICNNKCQNLFVSSPYEISIAKQGSAYILSSNLKDATIYLKYWKYPLDENNLPMVPEEPIILEAIKDHLTAWFLVEKWTNSDDVNIENKIKYWEEKSRNSLAEAKIFSKFPSFETMVNMGRVTRRRWSSYEIQNFHR